MSIKRLVALIACILALGGTTVFAAFHLLEGTAEVTVVENPLTWVSDPTQILTLPAGGTGIMTWEVHNSGDTDLEISWTVDFDDPDIIVYAPPHQWNHSGIVPAAGDLEISVGIKVDSLTPPGTVLTGVLHVHMSP